MNPLTLKTILNNAPIILQGANSLIKLIRERNKEQDNGVETKPVTIESLQEDIQQIENRLNANDESDVEQIKLIEQLAKQNETLAASLNNTVQKINTLTIVAGLALLSALLMLLLFINE